MPSNSGSTMLVMTAILISGMVSLGIAGDYVYFGDLAGDAARSAAC